MQLHACSVVSIIRLVILSLKLLIIAVLFRYNAVLDLQTVSVEQFLEFIMRQEMSLVH